MKTCLKLSGLFFLVLFSAITQAEENKKEKIQKLLEVSGTKEQVASIVPSVEQSLNYALQFSKNKKTDKVVFKTLVDKLKENNIYKTIAKEMNSKISDPDLKAILEWYKTPFSKKITAMEVEGSKVSATDLQQFALSLQKNPPKQQRIQMIAQFIKLTGGMALNLEIAKAVALAREMGLNKAKPKKEQKSTVEVISKVEMQEPTLKQQVATSIVLSHLNTYKNLSDQEMIQYLNFMSQEHSRRFYKIIVSASKDGFTKSIHNLDRNIASEMRKKNGF